VTDPLPFLTRLWFAWVCYFRILWDAAFARRVWDARAGEPRLPPPAEREPDDSPALLLLGLLQREGRLVDFLQQDIAAFSDTEIGAVARVVHDGCRRALSAHVTIVPVRTEAEGGRVTLEAGFDAGRAKLLGNVRGAGPYQGLLRHRGWRVEQCDLPRSVGGHDPKVLCPAEVEL
jgi:hypothetical protein